MLCKGEKLCSFMCVCLCEDVQLFSFAYVCVRMYSCVALCACVCVRMYNCMTNYYVHMFVYTINTITYTQEWNTSYHLTYSLNPNVMCFLVSTQSHQPDSNLK